MKATILVLSVDEAPLLEHSLPAAVAQRGCRVVVIDNACTDGTVEAAERSGAELVRLGERVSYAAAINAGIARSGGDAVLLLNADCFLAPDFVERALPRLRTRGVGSVAGKLLRALGPDPAQRLDVIDAAGMFVDRRRKNGLVGHGAPGSSYSAPGPCFGPDGACALYRRETLEQCAVGGEVLDEDMALWASDADLAWRAQLLGWSSFYEPAAMAWHIRSYSPTTRAALPAAHRRLQFRNRLVMAAKNETGAGLLRNGPWIAAYEAAALGYALVRERELLPAYAEAWRLRRRTRARRRVVQDKRVVARPPFGLVPRP